MSILTNITWVSEEQKISEWDYAKQHLFKNGKLLPDGTKLRRKDHGDHLQHSFIVLNGTIMAMAPKGEHLGKGSYAHAKLAEDDKGGLWAIKIAKRADSYGEEATAIDLQKAVKSSLRKMKEGGYKSYLPCKYLGQTLDVYLREHPYNLSDAFRMAYKLCIVLNELHSGVLSLTEQRYIHHDFHEENVTVDAEDNFHLIDFGRTYKITADTQEAQNREIAASLDLSRLCNVIKNLLLNATDINPGIRQLIEDRDNGNYDTMNDYFPEKTDPNRQLNWLISDLIYWPSFNGPRSIEKIQEILKQTEKKFMDFAQSVSQGQSPRAI